MRVYQYAATIAKVRAMKTKDWRVLTEAEQWEYHADNYGWRRVDRDDYSTTSPTDSGGDFYDGPMAQVAEDWHRWRRSQHRPNRDRELTLEGRAIINAWARSKGYADVDAYAEARGINPVSAYVEYVRELEKNSRAAPRKRGDKILSLGAALGLGGQEIKIVDPDE